MHPVHDPAPGPGARLGALVVAIDFDGVPPDEWAEWYDTDHVPERMRLTGWLTGARWMAADGSRSSLGVYDLADADLLRSAEYQAIVGEGATPWTKRMHRLRDAEHRPSRRFECVQVNPGNQTAPPDADYLLLYAMDVDPAVEDDFAAWYDEEHLPALRNVPGVICGRRFVVTNADARLQKYMATYHVEAPDVHRSAEWREVRSTPWTKRIAPQLQRFEQALYARPGVVGS